MRILWFDHGAQRSRYDLKELIPNAQAAQVGFLFLRIGGFDENASVLAEQRELL